MSNFELIDNYLTNRLNESERSAFEQQMKSDPALKADVEFQASIVEGLKKARVAELKAMLNKVPVNSAPVQFSALKLASGLVGTAVLVSAIYLYFKEDNQPEVLSPTTPIEDSIKQREQTKEEVKATEEVTNEDQSTEVNKKPEDKKEQSVKPAEKITPSKNVTKPTLDVVDPSEDLTESTPTRETVEPSKPGFATPAMEVEVDSASKKYNFHYQFVDGKMILFGSFDKSLYEILEINGGTHATFLFYKENYFTLDESRHEITPLEVIKDKALIKKLKEYRNK
ncbi:MAG: hypothetical protein ABL895_07375 [Cyclobacteriaceae bacterium]